MKKNRAFSYAILAIVFIVVSVVVFSLPLQKLLVYWVTYSFTIIAFMLQIVIWYVAFKSEETLKSKFLGFPIIQIGIIYLIVQLAVLATFQVLPLSPSWVPIIICVFVFGLFSICLIATNVGRNEVTRIEQKVKQKNSYLTELQIDIDILSEKQTDSEVKIALAGLSEKLRYSDPMSSNMLIPIEIAIHDKVVSLKTANKGALLSIIKEIEPLLSERNKKCKLVKHSM